MAITSGLKLNVSKIKSPFGSSATIPKISAGGGLSGLKSQAGIKPASILTDPGTLLGQVKGDVANIDSTIAVEKRVSANEKKISIIKNILKTQKEGGNKVLEETNDILKDIGGALALDFANRIGEKERKLNLARKSLLATRKAEKEKGVEGSDKVDKEKSFLNRAFDKVTKPAIDMFGKIVEFFALLGAGILTKGAFDWLQKEGSMDKVKSVFEWLGNNWSWIAGAFAIAGVAVAVGLLVSTVAGIGTAISAVGAVLAALAPVAWPLLAIAAVGLGGWFGYKWLKKKISGGGDFETFDKKLREKTEASGLDFKNAGTGALVLGDDGKSITVPWFGKDGISGKEWKPGDGNKNAQDDLNIKNEAHRAYIERTMGKEKLAQLDKAYETYVTLMGQKDAIKKKMESEIDKAKKEFYNSARMEEDKLRAEGKIGGANWKKISLTGAFDTSAGKFWAKKDKEWKNIDEEIRAKYDLILAEEFADVFNFSTGGTVTGPDGIDNISVKLTAGEEVITKESASLFRPLLKDINNNAGEMWLSLEKGIKQQTVNNESQDKVNAEFNKILVGFNSQLAEISSNRQTGGSVSVSSRPPVSPQIGGSSVSAVPKQVGSLQKSSSVSVVQLDIPSQNLDIDARSKQSEAPQTTLVKPSTTVLGDTIIPSPMDPYNSGRLSEAFDVYGIIG